MRRARTRCSPSGRTRSDRARSCWSARRATRCGSPRRRPRSCAISTAPGSGRCRARCCCRKSGGTIRASPRTRSRPTSIACARRSRRMPPFRRSWSPRRAATSWCPEHDPEKWEPVFGLDHAPESTLRMTIEDDIAFLERVPSFAILGRDALRILAIGAESRYVHGGEVLFTVGDPADAGYVIQDGSFTLKTDNTEASAAAMTVTRGALLGEL